MNHRKNKSPLSPHQRIIQAAIKGKGVRLSAGEVWKLSHDDAVVCAAHNASVDSENTTDWHHSGYSYVKSDYSE